MMIIFSMFFTFFLLTFFFIHLVNPLEVSSSSTEKQTNEAIDILPVSINQIRMDNHSKTVNDHLPTCQRSQCNNNVLLGFNGHYPSNYTTYQSYYCRDILTSFPHAK